MVSLVFPVGLTFSMVLMLMLVFTVTWRHPIEFGKARGCPGAFFAVVVVLIIVDIRAFRLCRVG